MEFLKKFTKKDLAFSLTTGLATGIIAWRILLFLSLPVINLSNFNVDISFSSHWLISIIPIFWILGVNLGYFLGKWVSFFNQFGRYVAVGFTNFFVDNGVLNLLIGLTSIESGWHYSLFKTISFIVAVSNSYALNKYWVFEAASSGGGRSELFKFLSVNLFAIIINVAIASFIVNYTQPFIGLDAKTWANFGSVVGSATAIMFTFVGSRLIVFKKNDNVIPQV